MAARPAVQGVVAVRVSLYRTKALSYRVVASLRSRSFALALRCVVSRRFWFVNREIEHSLSVQYFHVPTSVQHELAVFSTARLLR